MEEYLTLSHATERDVDLLLIEELVAGPDMLAHFLSEELAVPVGQLGYRSHRVRHSARRIHNRREIDIEVEITGPGLLPYVLLVENKLDAAEQPRQAESYREEARLLVHSGRAERAWSMLVCPGAYARANQQFTARFDGAIHYENLRDMLRRRADQATGELSIRLRHRAALLEQAIEKSRRGYVSVPLPIMAEFNRSYVALLRDRHPKLLPGPSMLKDENPGESVTMIFAPETLPRASGMPKTRLVHQLREANANLNLYGWGDRFGDLAERFAPLLRGTGFKLQPTINRRKGGGSSLMVIASTPKIDNQGSFDAQRADIATGMAEVERLRCWFTEHLSTLQVIARTQVS